MSSPFIPLGSAAAKDLVRTDMTFAGWSLGDWLEDQISDANSHTYVATLAPIKLARKIKIVRIRRKTRLRFKLTGSGKRLRFQGLDSDKRSAPFNLLRPWRLVLRLWHLVLHPESLVLRPWRLDDLGETAIALVLDSGTANHAGCGLSVNSSAQGDIIDEHNLGQGKNGKQIFIWQFRVIDPADMVGWYDPMQLFRTAIEVFFSTLFGRHSDYRLMEALTRGSDSHFDFTQEWKQGDDNHDEPDIWGKPREDIWIDYVGDVGDGWNSTYAIAHCLAQPELLIESKDKRRNEPCRTKRGDILIFGGDQVYPIANRLNYKQRLVGPYQTALDETDPPHPHAFAIPGNHDWYDSLVSFTRLFCQQRFFAGWQTDQSRSYFALKLPGHWWLLGTDVQLDSDIDVPQVNYFKKVADEQIQPGDRVIICTAEPHWVYAALYAKDDSNYNENNLAYFEKRIIGDKAKVVAFIAGDQHHYRRFEAKDCTQKITAGGGGAFLHPTHGEELQSLKDGSTHQRSYPSKSESKARSLRNLAFIVFNPWFGLLTGLFYMLTSWTVMANLSEAETFRAAASMVLDRLAVSPAAVFWVVTLFAGFVLFTDTHSKPYRLIAGPIHGAAHVLAVFFIGWGATYFTVSGLHLKFGSFSQLVSAGVIIFFGGWLAGSVILGLYLLISLNLFRRHSNEAFSALSIQDWKNFLRIRIEDNGKLTIFPIGLRKVPRKWNRRKDGQKGPGYEPAQENEIKPILIEGPLLFTPVSGTNGDVCVTISDEACIKTPNDGAAHAVGGQA